MTIYRRNPLLMTVMGANPGPRTRKTAERALDHAISKAWAIEMSGVQVPVLDIPRIFRDIKLELAGGVPLADAVRSVGAQYRVNRNPMGEAIVGGVAGAVASHIFQSNPSRLRIGERVRVLDSSGVWSNTEAVVSLPFDWREEQGAYKPMPQGWVHLRTLNGTPFTMPRNRIVSVDPRTRGMQSNPGPSFVVIDAESGVVVYTKRATGVGSEAIASCVAKARIYAQRTGRPQIVFLDIQGVKVGMKLHVGMVRALGITEEVFPEGPRRNPRPTRRNPAIQTEWNTLTGRRRLAVLEFAGIPSDDAPFLAKRQWAALPDYVRVAVAKGWRDTTPGKGTTRMRRLQPAQNPGSRGKRKITMTISRFAAWVKSKKDPAMWKAFLAKFRGYEKWTHGAKARKVTVEWVDTPGVNGLWITYDGGKQPESTYIMPKGSPRTGAWKHPWDTMPDIKHDPEAKIVITKLRGSSKITDFYHK